MNETFHLGLFWANVYHLCSVVYTEYWFAIPNSVPFCQKTNANLIVASRSSTLGKWASAPLDWELRDEKGSNTPVGRYGQFHGTWWVVHTGDVLVQTLYIPVTCEDFEPKLENLVTCMHARPLAGHSHPSGLSVKIFAVVPTRPSLRKERWPSCGYGSRYLTK